MTSNLPSQIVWPVGEGLISELADTYGRQGPRALAPRISIVGPRQAGKTLLLQRVGAALAGRRSDGDRVLTCWLDLGSIGTGRESELYRRVFRQLCDACAALAPMPADGPSDGSGRLEHWLAEVVGQVQGQVVLLVDHLDGVSRAFSQSLLRQLRVTAERGDVDPDRRRIGWVLSGTASLFDLRRSGDSAFLASRTLVLPVRNALEAKQAIGRNVNGSGPLSERFLDLLAEETGGERIFVDLVLPPVLASTIDRLEEAYESAVRDAIRRMAPSPLFRTLALELWTSQDLRLLVRELATSDEPIAAKDNTPDVDQFCLTGIVCLDRSAGWSTYRFRNGIVRRFARAIMDVLDRDADVDDVLGKELPRLLRELVRIREKCWRAPEIWDFFQLLEQAWALLNPGVPWPEVFIHVDGHGSADWWIAASARDVKPADQWETNLGSAVRDAVQEIAAGPRVNHSSGCDDEYAAFARSLQRRGATSIQLLMRFNLADAPAICEASFLHWSRLVDDLAPLLASAALAELGMRGVAARSANDAAALVARRRSRDVYWLPAEAVLIDTDSETRRIEGPPAREIESTVEDINRRCLHAVATQGTSEELDREITAVSRQLAGLLDRFKGLTEMITSDGGHELTVISEPDGLKVPFELLPHTRSYLAVQMPVKRRLLGARIDPDRSASLPQLVAGLKASGQALRVLLVGASAGPTLMNVEDELQFLEERITSAGRQLGLRVECVVVPPKKATVGGLGTALKANGPFHLFHFCGHAEHVADAPPKSAIVLAGEDGTATVVSCEQLRYLLEDRVLWFAYFSCCHGAAASGRSGAIWQDYVGLVDAVVAAGVPNAVGYRWAVRDSVAARMADRFYQAFLSGPTAFDPAAALLAARKASNQERDMIEGWAGLLVVCQSR